MPEQPHPNNGRGLQSLQHLTATNAPTTIPPTTITSTTSPSIISPPPPPPPPANTPNEPHITPTMGPSRTSPEELITALHPYTLASVQSHPTAVPPYHGKGERGPAVEIHVDWEGLKGLPTAGEARKKEEEEKRGAAVGSVDLRGLER